MLRAHARHFLSWFERISSKKGFEKRLLTDINRIPITEDYNDIHTYTARVKDIVQDKVGFILSDVAETDLEISEKYIGNTNIKLEIKEDKIYINDTLFSLVDFIDLGDSYNNGPKSDDKGNQYQIFLWGLQ